MRLQSLNHSFLTSAINKHGLEVAWKALLIAKVKSGGEQFSYILKHPEFRSNISMERDFTEGLSIGEISVLYEYALAYNDREKRKNAGQYFTPDDVSQFLASHERDFSRTLVWVDPCSGIGNLSYWLVKQQKDPEKFLLKRLYLIDKDPLALLSAKVLFTLAFQNKIKDLFLKMENRFLTRDFLSAKNLPKFDAAILNPPYVSGIQDDSFNTVSTRNLYAYFLERIVQLCAKGYISITPQTFTNGSRFQSLREILLNGHKTLDVYCFDNIPDNIFSGIKFGSTNSNKANSVRAGIIVAKDSKSSMHRITPLLRWQRKERGLLFKSARDFLTETSFTYKVFPKVGKGLVPLYQYVSKFNRTLRDLLVQKPTKYLLQVPTTPRYFISANKKPVNRTSFRTLYFGSQEDMDFAYVLLNSSYMYWWWRVHDGGMTISEQTLLDLPIPSSINSSLAKQFVKQLELSEGTSKVIKMNAGKPIENIKHSQELVRSITQLLFPKEEQLLTATHANSYLKHLNTGLQTPLPI